MSRAKSHFGYTRLFQPIVERVWELMEAGESPARVHAEMPGGNAVTFRAKFYTWRARYHEWLQEGLHTAHDGDLLQKADMVSVRMVKITAQTTRIEFYFDDGSNELRLFGIAPKRAPVFGGYDCAKNSERSESENGSGGIERDVHEAAQSSESIVAEMLTKVTRQAPQPPRAFTFSFNNSAPQAQSATTPAATPLSDTQAALADLYVAQMTRERE